MNRFLLILPIFLCFSATALAETPSAPISVRDCPGETEKANRVHVFIEDCLEEPCDFVIGRNHTLEMDIEFLGPVASLKAELWAMIGPVIWPGVNPNGCEDIISEGECPFGPGDYIKYGATFYISPSFPQITSDVMYILRDELDEIQTCWLIRANVVKPPS